MQDFREQLRDFQRTYVTRTTIFLAILVWALFVAIWYRGFSAAAFGALVTFQALCVFTLLLHRRCPSLARYTLIVGCALWLLGFMLSLREPLALLAMIPIGQLAGVLLPPWAALVGVGLMILGALESARWLSPGQWLSSPLLLSAVLTGAATALSLLWANNLTTALTWAYHSTQDAFARLAETREHRAQLYRVKKDLEEAYARLERANQMLVLARAEAEEAREARNRFVLAISHELRTPLNFIIGFSELMVNSPATYAPPDRWPPGLYADIQEIYRSSTHLLRLVNDVLELGQIEAQRMVLMKEWVDLAELIQEVEAMVRSAFARKGLWFRMDFDANLPRAFVDRTRIRQVLLNLVSNSLRFTERGGVTIRLRKGEEGFVVSVHDTGAGIAPEDLPKIFEEFRQVGSGSWRRREGFGLGLSISRRFVELHGGRMWVESQVGEGTSFYIALPSARPAHDLASSPGAETADDRYWRYLQEKAERARTVLVLSPDPAAGEVIARYAEGYHMVAVASLDQARSRLLELLPIALIFDRAAIEPEALQAMLPELPYDLPVIGFIFPGSPARPKYLPAGVCDYLVKPIAREALIEAVHALGPRVRSLLVVDDDPAMARFVTLALQSEGKEAATENGYRLMTAASGLEALEKARHDPPDALLLDLALPDISGWEVLERLRADPDLGEVPVILITAHDWPQMIAPSGCEALHLMMRRPLSRTELTSVLGNLLDAVRPTYPAPPPGPRPPTSPSG